MIQRSARCQAAKRGLVAACIVILTSCHTLQALDLQSKNKHPAPTCMDLVTLSAPPRALWEVPIFMLALAVLNPLGLIAVVVWYEGADSYCSNQAGSANCNSKLKPITAPTAGGERSTTAMIGNASIIPTPILLSSRAFGR